MEERGREMGGEIEKGGRREGAREKNREDVSTCVLKITT